MSIAFDRRNRRVASVRTLLFYLIRSLMTHIRRELSYRKTMRALQRLDDKGLRDIGLHRTSIGYERIAAPDEWRSLRARKRF